MSLAQQMVDAAFNGDLSALTKFVDDCADVDAMGRILNPLHAAIENHHPDCVAFLLARGADIEKLVLEMTPLARAVDIAIDGTIQSGGSPGDEPLEVVNMLLDAGANAEPAIKVAEAYRSDRLLRVLSAAQRAK